MAHNYLRKTTFYLINMGNWKLPFSGIAVIVAMLALTVYYLQFKSNRIFRHNIWHILSAGICYFSILTFTS